MTNLTKFKDMGIEMEGVLEHSKGSTHYIRTPFSGRLYEVKDEDLVVEEIHPDQHTTICTSSIVKIEDWLSGEGGTCLLQWEFHTDVNKEDGSVSSYIKVPHQKISIEWEESVQEEAFGKWLIIGNQYEGDGIELINKTNKNVAPKKIVLGQCGDLAVEV